MGDNSKRKNHQRSPQSQTHQMELDSKAPRTDMAGNTFDSHAPDAYVKAGLDPQNVLLAELLETRLSKTLTDSVNSQLKSVFDQRSVQMENRIEERVLSNVNKRLAGAERAATIAVAHVAKVNKEVAYVKRVNLKMLDRIIKDELELNKNNVIIYGLPESKDERSNDATLKKVYNMIHAIPCEQKRIVVGGVYKFNFKSIVIERCYRMGRFNRDQQYPRPVFIKIINFNHKRELMAYDNKKFLPKGVSLRNDYPDEIKSANRSLGPILEAASGTVYGTTRIRLFQGTIIIDNVKRYTLRNVIDLPKEIDYMSACFRETLESYAWFGILHGFSNFHWAPFTINKVTYYMTEQYISVQLAKEAKDEDAVVDLLNLQDSFEMKKRCKEIKGYSKEAWESKCGEVAYVGNKAKYDQNPYFAELLVSTHPKVLAEASMEEPWGCGLTLKHEDIKNPRKWPRQGVMGETLMIIRQDLIDARPEPTKFGAALKYGELIAAGVDNDAEMSASSGEEEASSSDSEGSEETADKTVPAAANADNGAENLLEKQD